MKTKERARVMRADRKSFAEISRELGISLQHAYKCAGDISRRPPTATRNTIIRYFAHNGGCSTQSGMMPVSLPRIVALHGEAA